MSQDRPIDVIEPFDQTNILDDVRHVHYSVLVNSHHASSARLDVDGPQPAMRVVFSAVAHDLLEHLFLVRGERAVPIAGDHMFGEFTNYSDTLTAGREVLTPEPVVYGRSGHRGRGPVCVLYDPHIQLIL